MNKRYAYIGVGAVVLIVLVIAMRRRDSTTAPSSTTVSEADTLPPSVAPDVSDDDVPTYFPQGKTGGYIMHMPRRRPKPVVHPSTPFTTTGYAKTARLSVASLNLGGQGPHKLSPSQIVHDVSAVADHADIIGLNEIHGPAYEEGLRDFLASHPAYRLVTPGRGADATPVLYNARKLVFSGATVTLASAPAGHHESPARHIVLSRFRDIATGRTVYHLNTHFIADAFNSKSTAQRRAIYAQDVTAERNVLAGLPKNAIVLGGGDFNDVHHAPGIGVVWGTVGHMLDRVFSRGPVRRDHMRIIRGLYTDHKSSPVVTYTVG